MFTRQDFRATAEMIRNLPKAKKQEFFDEWSQKFIASNIRFSEEKFAKACGIKPKPAYVYTPPPPETLAEVPKRAPRIRLVGTDKKTCQQHWDVFYGKQRVGYIYKNYYTTEGASFFVQRENNPYYTLLRHIHDGSYTGIYRICLILNSYTLNSDNTVSVDCTGRHLGWIVVKPNGLTTPKENVKTICDMGEAFDVYKDYKKVGVRKTKFGTYTDHDEGIFIKEQGGVFYPQIAVTHATVWICRRDAQRMARKVKGRAVPLAKFRDTYWEADWAKQSQEAREKELTIARERLNSGYV